MGWERILEAGIDVLGQNLEEDFLVTLQQKERLESEERLEVSEF